MRENWLFVGNPGTGKSTLLNCLAGMHYFSSGLSYGGGLTKELQTLAVGDVVYMDTPGLADRCAERKAAAAITQALRMGGRFKLCFVVRLEFGRVVCEDLVTIERVLDSICLPDVLFAVVVNNVSRAAYATLSSRQNEFKRVVALFNSTSYSTPYFVFIPRFHTLDQADDQIIDLPREIRASFDAFPSIEIMPSAVTEIVTFGYLGAVERMESRLETYRANDDELEVVTKRLERRRPGFWQISLMAVTVITRQLDSRALDDGEEAREAAVAREAADGDARANGAAAAVKSKPAAVPSLLREAMSFRRSSLMEDSPYYTTYGEGGVEIYRPLPIDTSNVELPPRLLRLVDLLAENAHEVWAKGRMDEGWTYGPARDDAAKKHLCLVPYVFLTDEEKEYDINIAKETLKTLLAMRFSIVDRSSKY